MTDSPLIISYSSTATGTGLDARCINAAKPMLLTAILSGPCVAICGAAFIFQDLSWALAHLILFASLLSAAVFAGRALRLRRTLIWDYPASIGLAGIAIAPLVAGYSENAYRQSPSAGLIAAFAFCYLLLTGASVRHVYVYRQIADWLADAGYRSLARSMRVLGWVKSVYEVIWLGLCTMCLAAMSIDKMRHHPGADAVITLAFFALFATLGFIAIWIWMVVMHSLLANVAARARRSLPRASVLAVESAR